MVEVPVSSLRADGRSIYQRHGGKRYATRTQLAMEERMIAHAAVSRAPRLTRAQAAHALGADLRPSSRTRLPAGRRTGAASIRRPGCVRTRPPRR